MGGEKRKVRSHRPAEGKEAREAAKARPNRPPTEKYDYGRKAEKGEKDLKELDPQKEGGLPSIRGAVQEVVGSGRSLIRKKKLDLH